MEKKKVTFVKGRYGKWEQPVYYIVFESDKFGQQFFYSNDLVEHINHYLNDGYEITIKKS